MLFRTVLSISAAVLLLQGCRDGSAEEFSVVPEYQTHWNQNDNIDSPAVWHDDKSGTHWLLATAKDAHAVYVYDAETGGSLDTLNSSDAVPGGLNYPNGIMVRGNRLFIVERDNHRISVFTLPELEYILSIGGEELIRPYGLDIISSAPDTLRLYVTDNYLLENESIPPLSELNERVKVFDLSFSGDSASVRFAFAFGDTLEGALGEVESIIADPDYDRLLISDEDADVIRIYDLAGHYTGRDLGKGIFRESDPEGIFLYACGDSAGYWFTTDQSKKEKRNLFHVFERSDLRHIGAFRVEGTSNTDGITLSVKGFPGFEKGAFFPVDDDGSVTAVRLEDLTEYMGLELNCY